MRVVDAITVWRIIKCFMLISLRRSWSHRRALKPEWGYLKRKICLLQCEECINILWKPNIYDRKLIRRLLPWVR